MVELVAALVETSRILGFSPHRAFIIAKVAKPRAIRSIIALVGLLPEDASASRVRYCASSSWRLAGQHGCQSRRPNQFWPDPTGPMGPVSYFRSGGPRLRKETLPQEVRAPGAPGEECRGRENSDSLAKLTGGAPAVTASARGNRPKSWSYASLSVPRRRPRQKPQDTRSQGQAPRSSRRSIRESFRRGT
jgi:hypothetical protein